MILSGRLTEEIRLKTVSFSATTTGAPVEVLSNYLTIYASITTQRGSNQYQTNLPGQVYTDTISFYCRYIDLPEAKKKYKILYKGELYRIVNLTHLQRNAATIIECVAVN